VERVDVSVKRPRCPYCHDEVDVVAEKVACDACMSWHHAACWREHGSCSSCGHARTSEGALVETESRTAPATRESGLAYAFGVLVGFLMLHKRWVGALVVVPGLMALFAFLGLWAFNDTVDLVSEDVFNGVLIASWALGTGVGLAVARPWRRKKSAARQSSAKE
jgi:hypothetical protein